MSDPIMTVDCQCGKTIKVRSSAAGKKVRCPQCETIVAIPLPQEVSTTAPNIEEEQSEPSDAAQAKAETREESPESTPKHPPDKPAVAAKPQRPTGRAAATTRIAADPAVTTARIGSTEPIGAESIGAEPTGLEFSEAGAINLGGRSSGQPVDESLGIELQPFGNDSPLLDSASDPSLDSTASGPVDTAAAASVVAVNRKAVTTPIGSTSAVDSPYSVTASHQATVPTRQYPTLDAVRKVYKILAYLIIGASVLFTISAIAIPLISGNTGDLMVGAIDALKTLLGGIAAGVSMLAFSEIIQVVLDIQDNTHRAAENRR